MQTKRRLTAATLADLDGVAGLQVREGFSSDQLAVDVVPQGQGQGEVAFERWTGIGATADVMRDALETWLAGSETER